MKGLSWVTLIVSESRYLDVESDILSNAHCCFFLGDSVEEKNKEENGTESDLT